MRYRYLLFIAFLLPAFVFRDYTPDNELRYISIIEEALRNNTWFTFFNHGEIYADKPPLYFWLLMFVRMVFGSCPLWAAGLFSLLPAVGILAVMDRWMRSEGRGHNPLVSETMLMSTGMFLGSALVLRMDMLMAFFIVLSLYTFFRMYRGTGRPSDRWLFPVWIFLAVFTKGPMGFLIPLVSVTVFLLFQKKIRTFGRYLGWKQWAILLGLCAAWFLLIYLEGGKEYLNNILFKQTVGRGINSFHHKEPFWYYLQHLPLTFAPWSLLYVAVLGIAAWKRRFTSETERFFLTVIVANFVLLSFISSKLDIYLLPVYPFVAYLTSMQLDRQGATLVSKICVAAPAAVFFLLFPAFFCFRSMIPFPYENLSMVYVGLAVLSVGGVTALVYLWKNNLNGAITVASLGLLSMVFIASFAIPQFNREIGFRAMAEEGRRIADDTGADSYAFYKFRNAADMDIYLRAPLTEVSSVARLDSLAGGNAATVLFIRNREVRREPELETWLGKRKALETVGDYRIYLIGGGF